MLHCKWFSFQLISSEKIFYLEFSWENTQNVILLKSTHQLCSTWVNLSDELLSNELINVVNACFSVCLPAVHFIWVYIWYFYCSFFFLGLKLVVLPCCSPYQKHTLSPHRQKTQWNNVSLHFFQFPWDKKKKSQWFFKQIVEMSLQCNRIHIWKRKIA